MLLEKLISEINQQISQIQEDIGADKIPDFKPVQQRIDQFTGHIKQLQAEEARQYTALLSVWSEEMRKSADILSRKMSDIKDELNNIQNQNKAIKGYNYLNN